MTASAADLDGLRDAIDELKPGKASKFDDSELQLLWKEKYRDTSDIIAANAQSLRAIGLPSGLVDHLKPEQGEAVISFAASELMFGVKDRLTM